MVSKERVEELMNEFNEKCPYGDSFELATFMYEKGKQDGFKESVDLMKTLK